MSLESRDRCCPQARQLCHGRRRLERPRSSPNSTASTRLRLSSANIQRRYHTLCAIQIYELLTYLQRVRSSATLGMWRPVWCLMVEEPNPGVFFHRYLKTSVKTIHFYCNLFTPEHDIMKHQKCNAM